MSHWGEVSISPEHRARLIHDGCVTERALACSICREPIEPGTAVHCNDGYDRVYGEFVLVELKEMYEDNWPLAHQRCASSEAHPAQTSSRVQVPRAVAVTDGGEVGRLARARIYGTAALGLAAAAAVGAVVWGGVGAGALVFGAAAGLVLVAWGLAVRPRD